jgi:hypothetical protein
VSSLGLFHLSNYLVLMEEHLFEIKLNTDGKNLLMRINNFGKFLFTCSLIIAAIDLISAFISLRAYNVFSQKSPEVLNFQTITSIIFLILYTVILPFHGYFFYRYTKLSKKAINYESSNEFNQSFEWLVKYIITVSILFGINVFFGIIVVYTQIQLAIYYKV